MKSTKILKTLDFHLRVTYSHSKSNTIGKIKERDMKVNCLIQAEIGHIEVKDAGLKQEIYQIMNSSTRIIKAMQQYLKSKLWFSALCNAITMHQCLASKMWENSPLLVRQLEKM
jgi:ATP-dependent DNA helicase HFM1/MER3